MNSKIAAITASALTMLASPMAASATPADVVGPAGTPVVTLVSGGCGIGFHRGPWGGCRPNVVYRAPGPRVIVRPAWGWHRPVYGWRPYRRW